MTADLSYLKFRPMTKARIYLTFIIVIAVSGAMFGNRVASKKLWYKSMSTGACLSKGNLTTNIGANPVGVPANAWGWYTNQNCTGNTFSGYNIED